LKTSFRSLLLGFRLVVCAAAGGAVAAAAAEEAPLAAPAAPADSLFDRWDMGDMIDRLPSFLANRLPAFDPSGAVRVYVQPHFGDLFHHGYVRAPVGARLKLTERIEASAEAMAFFPSPIGGEKTATGVASLNLGAQIEHVLPALNDGGGFSVGASYCTPFDHTPREFTDGYRHFQPYLAAARLLVPPWRLYGYANLGADFLAHTRLPSNFRRNQLHAGSLVLATGIARNWPRLQASLTARIASTALLGDEARQNFTLRPEIAVPLRHDLEARTQVFLTLGARVTWGPGGREIGSSGGLRVNFRFERNHAPEPKY